MEAPEATETAPEQPALAVHFRRTEIMPDGSIGAFFVGEFAGDRSKDLRLTVAQGKTLADLIQKAVERHGL